MFFITEYTLNKREAFARYPRKFSLTTHPSSHPYFPPAAVIFDQWRAPLFLNAIIRREIVAKRAAPVFETACPGRIRIIGGLNNLVRWWIPMDRIFRSTISRFAPFTSKETLLSVNHGTNENYARARVIRSSRLDRWESDSLDL